MAYPKLIREVGRPHVYELGPGGVYSHVPSKKEFLRRGYKFKDVQEVPNIGQYMYEPLYGALEEKIKGYYGTLEEQLGKKLQSEYAKRGILESGLYGKAYAEQTGAIERQKAAELAKIALSKLEARTTGMERGMEWGREAQRFKWEAKSQKQQQQWDMFQKLLATLT